jgi:hypothetical protein
MEPSESPVHCGREKQKDEKMKTLVINLVKVTIRFHPDLNLGFSDALISKSSLFTTSLMGPLLPECIQAHCSSFDLRNFWSH